MTRAWYSPVSWIPVARVSRTLCSQPLREEFLYMITLVPLFVLSFLRYSFRIIKSSPELSVLMV